jgi:hypothetical protein
MVSETCTSEGKKPSDDLFRKLPAQLIKSTPILMAQRTPLNICSAFSRWLEGVVCDTLT